MAVTQRERIIYRTSLHWITFIPSVLWLTVGFTLFFLHETYISPWNIQDLWKSISFWTAIIVVIIGLIMFFVDYIKHKSSEFAVTNYRVIIRLGVFNKTSVGMNLSNIESVEVEQPFFGQLLGYGTIQITGTGTADNKFHKIQNPAKFRKKLQITANRMSGEEDSPNNTKKTETRYVRRDKI